MLSAAIHIRPNACSVSGLVVMHVSIQFAPVPSSLHCQDITVAEAEEQVAICLEGTIRSSYM